VTQRTVEVEALAGYHQPRVQVTGPLDKCQRCGAETAHVWVNKKKLAFPEKPLEDVESLAASVKASDDQVAKAILAIYSRKELLHVPLCAECEKDLGQDWLDKNASFTLDELVCREVCVT
jgi:hypothetical protein